MILKVIQAHSLTHNGAIRYATRYFISIYKGIGNSAISSTAANRIVARLRVNTVTLEDENGRGTMSIAAF